MLFKGGVLGCLLSELPFLAGTVLVRIAKIHLKRELIKSTHCSYPSLPFALGEETRQWRTLDEELGLKDLVDVAEGFPDPDL